MNAPTERLAYRVWGLFPNHSTNNMVVWLPVSRAFDSEREATAWARDLNTEHKVEPEDYD